MHKYYAIFTYYSRPILRKMYFWFTKKIGYKKLIVGAADTHQPGWMACDLESLDITKYSDWRNSFHQNYLTNIVAEHVWEHLTKEQGKKAAKYCYQFLAPGGILRLAVPDGYHPSLDYQNYVSPRGSYRDIHHHQVLYNYHTLSILLSDVGFHVRKVEYFDESGHFHRRQWDLQNGMINRSAKYDTRNQAHQLTYTSLLIDAIKPLPEKH